MWRQRQGKYRFGSYCPRRWCWCRMIGNRHWNGNRDWDLDVFLANMSDLLLTVLFVKFLLDSLVEMLTSLLIARRTFPLRNLCLRWFALLVYLLL